MNPIVTCDNVSIRYITGDFKDIGLKEYLIRRLTGRYSVTEFWADRHVTFQLMPGDMLGIIGSNGAGKSTLLKAISGIMVPTEGTVRCSAKISALLELASGFDGDLTVRENTYLRAAMLGYSRDFVDATYDSIIDFAELGDFQDRPFKQLSSGMKSRLAFSIASLVNPEILILDEVLSVGDGAFRKKSEAKMRQIIGGGATTILVSHSVAQVRALCNKILWLNRGEQIAFGDNVQGLCDAYQRYLDTKVLPKPEELPPLNLSAPAAQAEPAAAPVQASPELEGAADSAEKPTKPRVSLRERLARMPRAASVTLIVALLLAGVIAVSEARLPGVVRALPADAERVVGASPQGDVTVCAWDGRLYAFFDRADLEPGATFAVRATDGHGNVTGRTFEVQGAASGRYSTDDELVLEVNLARFTGAVEVQYGQVASDAGVEGWLWQETYRP